MPFKYSSYMVQKQGGNDPLYRRRVSLGVEIGDKSGDENSG